MNVIRFSIEIERAGWFRKTVEPVADLVRRQFETDLQAGDGFEAALRKQWDDLEFREVSYINTSNALVGFTRVVNVRVFLFRSTDAVVVGRNNLSLDVIVVGDMQVEDLLNISFSKIVSILKKGLLKCKHINQTRIYIYPFDSSKYDIFTYTLQIRAELKSRFKVGISDLIKWAIFAFLLIVVSILYWKTDATNNADWATLYRSLSIAFFSVLLIDLVSFFLGPLFSGKYDKKVVINDLSSVLQAAGPHVPDSSETPRYEVPQDQ